MTQGAQRIRSPMPIMVGALDNLRPAAERLHEAVPHSRLCVIDGAAHSAHALREFLADNRL